MKANFVAPRSDLALAAELSAAASEGESPSWADDFPVGAITKGKVAEVRCGGICVVP